VKLRRKQEELRQAAKLQTLSSSLTRRMSRPATMFFGVRRYPLQLGCWSLCSELSKEFYAHQLVISLPFIHISDVVCDNFQTKIADSQPHTGLNETRRDSLYLNRAFLQISGESHCSGLISVQRCQKALML
jgi:hypothetical protein